MAVRHQAITWNRVKSSSARPSDIHLRAISQQKLHSSITWISLKMTPLKFYSNILGANELMAQLATGDKVRHNPVMEVITETPCCPFLSVLISCPILNPLWPDGTWSPLVSIMSCNSCSPFGTKPLPETVIIRFYVLSTGPLGTNLWDMIIIISFPF